MKHFEFLEHTADVIVRASGDNLEEAFAAAGEAMFALITDISSIEPVKEISIEIESPDRNSLLVRFLSELILIHEVDLMLFREIDVTLRDDNQLTAVGYGERFDPNRHEPGLHVKAVSYHMLEIAEETDKAWVQVLFDV
ncbi:MAG: archease [candidate division Zixibacteria bacterium]|nr:archease [candidate division Zixibacteria bacterium]